VTPSFPSPPEELLAALAHEPRGTGGPAIAAARVRCTAELRALGFEVAEQRFVFSAFPGRFATPLLGGAAAAVVGFAGRAALARGFDAGAGQAAPLVIMAAGVAAIVASGWWLAARGVLDGQVLRTTGCNLQATRGRGPRVWLCAHLDSKSQPVPTLVRSAGIVIEAIGVAFMLALSVALALGAALPAYSWVQAGLLTLVGALPVVFSTVGNRSPGAFDNASGVATVLAAAALLSPEEEVGVLITDAEELGLAGARAWCALRSGVGAGPAVVLNCDGVDDTGGVVVMHGGRVPAAIRGAVARASADLGIDCELTRMPPGILTDSVAFAGSGIPGVTFSRGTIRSLARVHSRRDSLARLRGTGIAPTSALMAQTARHLLTGNDTWKH
jgi:hypothetical protein